MSLQLESDLCAKVRELITSGVLPNEPPVIQRSGEVGTRRQGACAICTEPDPTVIYFWTGGVMVQLHAACDALWKQELERKA
jgi:hypothetical protein